MEENVRDFSEEPVVPVKYSDEMRRLDFDTVAEAMGVFSYVGVSYDDEITPDLITVVQDMMINNLKRVLEDLEKAEVEHNSELITNYAVRDSIFLDTNHIVDAFDNGEIDDKNKDHFIETLKQGYSAARGLIDNITSKAKDIKILHDTMDYTQELIDYYSDPENVKSAIMTYQMQEKEA